MTVFPYGLTVSDTITAPDVHAPTTHLVCMPLLAGCVSIMRSTGALPDIAAHIMALSPRS